MKERIGKTWVFAERILLRMDRIPLWWFGILLLVIDFLPIIKLGTGSVFLVHDQLDESMMNYVLTARHAGQSLIPEMLGGINSSGLTPAAVLFLPLFRLLPPFYAFLCAYAIIFLCGFYGMYLLIRELTESNVLAVVFSSCFAMQPLYIVYGLSQMGIPLVFYAFLCLCKSKKKILSVFMILFFGLTSHLVYTGYCVLGFMFLAILFLGLRKRPFQLPLMGFVTLLATYICCNWNLFREILFGKGNYVSHREEFINNALPFGETVWSVFTKGSQHVFSYQEYLLFPMICLLLLGVFFFPKWEGRQKLFYIISLAGLGLLFLIAVFFGICKTEMITEWKNTQTGFLRYFQIERFYWLYPAGWFIEMAMVLSCFWTGMRSGSKEEEMQISRSPILWYLILAITVFPTAHYVLYNSYFYMNINQYNNGSAITGYISWESYYAEDLMQEIDRAIGRNRSDYRIVHLGISPAPALMHGFYTVDGYSNNYSLSYKHAFRQVIARKLEKSPETAAYFDGWGNRCYLMNSQTGTAWMLPKENGVLYKGLEFDWVALKELGCEYLFSGAEIADAEEAGLEMVGYYETDDSYWGIWVYHLEG